MDPLLLAIAAVFMVAGLIGSIVPVVPGAPLSWVGLLIFYLTSVPFNFWFLGTTLAISLVIVVLQYTIPAYGTKRYGGSKLGMAGTLVGLVIGIIIPIPLGFLIGPFIGAFIGELINKSNSKTALRAAYGSFIGFLASTFIELVVCFIFFGIYIWKIWQFRETLF